MTNDKKIWNGENIDIPESVGVCPECGASLVADIFEVSSRNGRTGWKVWEDGSGLHIQCTKEDDYHYKMPYVDWLPLDEPVIRWLNKNYDFDPIDSYNSFSAVRINKKSAFASPVRYDKNSCQSLSDARNFFKWNGKEAGLRPAPLRFPPCLDLAIASLCDCVLRFLDVMNVRVHHISMYVRDCAVFVDVFRDSNLLLKGFQKLRGGGENASVFSLFIGRSVARHDDGRNCAFTIRRDNLRASTCVLDFPILVHFNNSFLNLINRVVYLDFSIPNSREIVNRQNRQQGNCNVRQVYKSPKNRAQP